MSNPTSLFNTDINKIKIYSFSGDKTYEFSAFLTDFSDQKTSNWTPQDIYGRMDPIYTYKNTVRKITIAFDIPSYDEKEALDNYINIKNLQNCLYPVYDTDDGKGTATLSTPPFFRIKFANLISGPNPNGLLGWIDSLNFKPELESGFFILTDISDGGLSDEMFDIAGESLIPKLLKISFSYNVIHEKPLGFRKDHSERSNNNISTSSQNNIEKAPTTDTTEFYKRASDPLTEAVIKR